VAFLDLTELVQRNSTFFSTWIVLLGDLLSKGIQHGVVSNFTQKEIDIAGINMPVQIVPDDDQRLSHVEDILEAGEISTKTQRGKLA
jgi:hypothetical protein